MPFSETDAICCLRYPIFEGGSASLIVAMLSGRTVLVSDHGAYAGLPDDVVMKCWPGVEAADVRRHLEACLADRDAMWDRGARALAYAREMNSPEHYARALIAAIEQGQAGGPEVRTGLRFGRILASFGLGVDDPAARMIAETLGGLLGTNAG